MKKQSQRRWHFRTLIYGSFLAITVLVLLLATGGNAWAVPVPDDANISPDGLSSLGDTVWHDINEDGFEDGGEPGIAGVQVNLWLVGPNFDPPGTGDSTFVGSQITNGVGFYKFENIDALGNWYWVEIDDSNFDPFRPLDGWVLTSGNTIPGGPPPLLVQLDKPINDYIDADFGYAQLGQVLVVTKTVNPTSRPEPGGSFEFTVRLDNTSTVVSLIIDSLVDDIHGDLDGQGTCDVSPPLTIPTGSSYQCSFTATFTGDPGDTETDTVTAEGEGDQGNDVSGSDDATVEITDVPSSIEVIKTANPTQVQEPGGTVSFTVRLENTSTVDDVTIDSLSDDVYGDLDGKGTCSVPQDLAPGAVYQCAFTGAVSGNAGDSLTDVVTASGLDDDDNPVSDDDDATVEITDTPSSIDVTKTANPTQVQEPGGTVSFTVRLENTSTVDTVVIIDLDDNIYGDITGITGSTCTVPRTLFPGAIYQCAFPGPVTGNAGDVKTDIVIASGTDDDGKPVSDSDDADVTITDVDPVIDVVKTANPTSVPEPGGNVTFTVVVTNNSNTADPVKITSLEDNVYGNLHEKGNCRASVAQPQTLLPGGSYTCSFIGAVAGSAGDVKRDTVTASGTDDEGNHVSDSDFADVTITDQTSSIQVTKTADPTSVPEPGGNVTFSVVVQNTSTADTVTIRSLQDNIYGDLNGQGTCVVSFAVPRVLIPGATYSCSFPGPITGNAGDVKTDIVIASGTDDDGKPVSDSDDADVTITDVDPVIDVVKTANPTSVPEPGGNVTFTVVVTNNSNTADPVKITSMDDSIHGNLKGRGSCSVPQTILPGSFYECSFAATVTGSAGYVETDVVTVTGMDDDGNPVTDSDDATVTITQAPGLGCVIIRKIDDQGVGLPAWEIHGLPVGQQTPHLGGYTDGTGYIRFDGLQPGTWNFWEMMQDGWEPVTAEMVETEISDGPACAKVLFINRQVPFCVEGYKIDDDHVRLPGWEIHALPTSGWPPRGTYTDANGYFRFDNLTIEEWRFWEIMQDGWLPVTEDTFTIDPTTHPNPPPAGQCYQIRFKNKQVLPPTATPTPTYTPTPEYTPTPTYTPTPRYTPTHTPTPGVCETGRLETTIWGQFYSIRLDDTGIIHPLKPLPWQHETVFNIVGYTGPVKWTLYQPYWEKQVGGYQYVYPGGHAGDDFTLFVKTDCGELQLQTAVDDPTATPDPNGGFNVWLPVIF